MISRISISRLLLLSLITLLMLWFFNYSSISKQASKKPIHLHILTTWRSGSSFLGQIFNHHQDVFYLFEPARMVWVKFPSESAELLHYPIRDLLRSLYNCDVSLMHSYLPRRGSRISDLPFWTESRALCSAPACKSLKHNKDYDRPTCFKYCGGAPLEKMAESCKAHSHIVLKVVRILDLSVLLPLFQDPTIDFRVVHLVRDPRAVASSRSQFNVLHKENLILNGGNEKINKTPNMTQTMDIICRAQVAINKVGTSLERRYMMIRYEDLASKPLYYVKKLYNFAGLRMTSKLESWVYNITHKESPQKIFMNFAGISKMIAQKWRTNIKYSTVVPIQDKCNKAMKVFGYKQVRSMEELTDLTFDVVIKRNGKS